MLIVSTEITVEQQGRSDNKTYTFDYCNSINIESSWDLFTDKGEVVLPNRFPIKRKNQTTATGDTAVFKRGDKITIKKGYNDKLKTILKGYITKVKPGTPLTLMVEDSMWLLKQRNIASKSWANPTIKEVIEYCLGDLDVTIDYSDDTIQLGKFVIDNQNTVNIVSVLDVVKKQFGILCFFVGETLKVGLLSELRSRIGQTFVFNFEKNIIDNSLEAIREDDVALVIKGVSFDPDANTKIERWGAINSAGNFQVTTTQQQGELRTVLYYDLTADQLKARMEEDRFMYIYTGYKGSFTTFGEPNVSIIDTVTLTDPRISDYDGEYLIKKITYSHGVNGSRQSIELQAKIAN